ncbi:MAG TPA: hypothetical protein VGR03_13140 [Candidatus Acidoferrum sp.]|nr:hypothetical protein [Candidatus Acidoferrum sp.]
MRRLFVMCGIVCFAAATASAQTKVTGTAQFGKAEGQQMLPAGDRADHSLGIGQRKCTWTKPQEIGGDKTKEGVSTESMDISGNNIRSRGMHVTTMESGDKYFVSYQGTGTLKDGALQSGKGTWMYTGGSGKLKGIKGKGTYTCAASGDSVSCDIEGEYQLAK